MKFKVLVFFFFSFSEHRFLLYKSCNMGYKHASILHKNHSLKPAMSFLRILWLLFSLWLRFSCMQVLEAAAILNKDLFLQKVAFKQLQRTESPIRFKAKFSLVEDEIFLLHLQEVLLYCYLGVLLMDPKGGE